MKKLIKLIILLAILTTSCSKEDEAIKSAVSVRYEVTWSGTPVTGHGNSISYSSNGQNDTNLSGSSWNKTVTIDTRNMKQLVLLPIVKTSKSGTCTAKIYVDGKVKAENQPPSTVNGAVYLHSTTAIFDF